jgi:hypothetical protein
MRQISMSDIYSSTPKHTPSQPHTSTRSGFTEASENDGTEEEEGREGEEENMEGMGKAVDSPPATHTHSSKAADALNKRDSGGFIENGSRAGARGGGGGSGAGGGGHGGVGGGGFTDKLALLKSLASNSASASAKNATHVEVCVCVLRI